MKKSRRMLALVIALIMIVAFIPFTSVNAGITDTDQGESGTGNIIRKTTTNYFTTVELRGKLVNENTGEELTYTKASEEITGNTDSNDVIFAVEDLTAGFVTWATENGATEENVKFVNNGVASYYYDAHDEITQQNVQPSTGDVILVGDLEDLNHAYQNQGQITINTILDKHQTVVIDATATVSEHVYDVLKGNEQKVNTAKNEELSFEFDIAYTKFQASGKVFVDDEETSNYESREGSTIITFDEDYAKELSVGEHTVKVTVNDGYAQADFTITKTTNPKTGDELAIYIAVFVIAALGAIIIKKNIK